MQCSPLCDRQSIFTGNGRQLLGIGVGVFKKPEFELQAQNIACCRIDHCQVDLAVIKQRLEVVEIRVACHFHIDARRHRLESRLTVIFGKAVNLQLPNGVPVADDQTLVSPLAAQHPAQQEFVAGCRHAIYIAERGHEGRDTGVGGCFERGQVDVTKLALRDVGCSVITSGFGRPVSRKMLGAGCNVADSSQIITLESLDSGCTHNTREIGILAVTLGDSPPARIA